MLPPDAPFTPWVVGVVLVGMLAVLVVRAVRRDRREYGLFKRYRSTVRRQRMLRKWLLESVLWLGGSALILLVLVWPFIGRMLEQVEQWPAMVAFRAAIASGGGFAQGAIIGGSVALVAGVVLSVVFAKTDGEVPTLGDIHALLPRNRAELKYGWALSINAGVVEELLFRLALPAALFAVCGNALAAVLVSLVVFGGMHAYQGIGGVIGTLVFGAILMFVFLATGSILWAILAHALFDLRSLVLIPVAVYKVHRKTDAAVTPDP
jgi:membrane protease YdiL (CAAX protease family)